MATDIARRRQYVLQVGRTVLVGRGANRDELDVAVRHAGCDIGRKLQAASGAVACHDLFQARFVNRDAAVVQDVDLVLVDVETEHVVAEFRQAGAGDQAYVTGADNGNFHV